jgi:hypothetical protein
MSPIVMPPGGAPYGNQVLEYWNTYHTQSGFFFLILHFPERKRAQMVFVRGSGASFSFWLFDFWFFFFFSIPLGWLHKDGFNDRYAISSVSLHLYRGD